MKRLVPKESPAKVPVCPPVYPPRHRDWESRDKRCPHHRRLRLRRRYPSKKAPKSQGMTGLSSPTRTRTWNNRTRIYRVANYTIGPGTKLGWDVRLSRTCGRVVLTIR